MQSEAGCKTKGPLFEGLFISGVSMRFAYVEDRWVLRIIAKHNHIEKYGGRIPAAAPQTLVQASLTIPHQE